MSVSHQDFSKWYKSADLVDLNSDQPVEPDSPTVAKKPSLKNGATKKKPATKPLFPQFFAIIVLSISIFLVVDLGRRAAANYRVQREAEQLSQQVESARQYQADLLARRSYVASDLYVEEVARNELKWAKPGEAVVAILPTSESTTAPTDVSTTLKQMAPVTQTPAQAWWSLFFGEQNRQP